MYNEHRESLRPQVWSSNNNCSFSLTSQAGVEHRKRASKETVRNICFTLHTGSILRNNCLEHKMAIA